MTTSGDHSPESLITFFRYGFYLSVLLLFYGTFFPFHFDFSEQTLHRTWSEVGFIPYWNIDRGRIPSVPDMVSNVLLTLPIGFFGLLWRGRNRQFPGIARWFVLGFCLGLLVEFAQLGIPSRTSDITDALNNGLGAFGGALLASMIGKYLHNLLAGSLLDRKSTYCLILTGTILAGMLLPFDFSIEVSHLRSSLRSLLHHPWEPGSPLSDEWIEMAKFILLGAIVGRMNKPRLAVFAIMLPFILEPMQLIVESHVPSLRDLFINFVGIMGGLATARIFPALVRPATGLVIMSAALIAQGLSPYSFGAQHRFEWVPLVEYYRQTTGAALYDAMAGLLNYGLLTAIWPKRISIFWAVLLAGGIEAAQIFISTRSAGITDILIAGIGAWVGFSILQAMNPIEKTA
jgi:glycopeptide antibiotics resistance protein